MGRGKIEREINREKKKKKISLGRNARRRAAVRIAAKETRERATKRELLREKEDS